jgi:hypothetical protein
MNPPPPRGNKNLSVIFNPFCGLLGYQGAPLRVFFQSIVSYRSRKEKSEKELTDNGVGRALIRGLLKEQVGAQNTELTTGRLA